MDLLTLYQSRVDAGVLRDDPAQRAILPEFERTRAALAQPVKKGFFRKAPPPP
ncbi:MAG: cell division protein ZapE, partial [Rhodobacteraceae bacterium]|nr:cell division protein ZapE [Paracoccaceae bacterium]